MSSAGRNEMRLVLRFGTWGRHDGIRMDGWMDFYFYDSHGLALGLAIRDGMKGWLL